MRTASSAVALIASFSVLLRFTVGERTLISAGCSNRMIAARLHLATSTVKSHVESILGRLQARNRAEAVAIAARLRLLTDAAQHSSEDGEAARGAGSQNFRMARAANLTASLGGRF